MADKLTQGKESSVHNPLLRDALRELSQLSLELISTETHPDDMPPKVRALHAIRQTPHTFGIEEIDQPDWSALVRKFRNELKSLPAYSECQILLEEDETISRHLDRRVGIPNSMSILPSEELIPSFLCTLLERTETCTYHEGIFDALYDELERFFRSGTLLIRAIAPLLNFSGPDEVIGLPHDISIRPTSDDEVDLWLQRSAQMPLPAGPWMIASVTHCIVREFEMPKVCGEKEAKEARTSVPESAHADSQASQSFDNVLTSLRLLKSQYVDVPFTYFRVRGWCPPHVGAHRWHSGVTPPRFLVGNPFVLSPEEGPVVSKLFRLVTGFDRQKHGFLDIALRRFNAAVEEERPEDKLLDLVIALEALLLPDTREELTFRFSLRGAYFLASDEAQRQRYYQEFKKAYRLRSKIVHGDQLPREVTIFSQRIPIKEFVNRIENHTREVAKRMILLATQPNATRELVQWDDLVLGATEFNWAK